MIDAATRGNALVRWWLRRSLQARLTAAMSIVVAVGLLIGSVLVVSRLQASLRTGVDEVVRQRVLDVATLDAKGALPKVISSAGQGEVIVQVVNQRGLPVAATPDIDGQPRIFTFPGTTKPVVRNVTGDQFDEAARFRVAVLASGRDTIYAAAPLEAVDQSVRRLVTILAIGGPIAMLALTGLGWLVVGRTLRPVEALRAQAASIPGTGIQQRLDLPAAHDEIHRLAVTLNDLLGRVEDASHQQRAFVADAAHELRSPVASLLTQLEVASAHPHRVQPGSLVADLLDDTRRLDRLVGNLLQLAKLDARPSHQQVPVDLDEVVLSEVRNAQRRSGVSIDATAVSAARVSGDRDVLAGAVRNLLDNAIRHAASAVRVSLEETDHWAILVVADDGSGVPVADRERIFTRFTRLDEARARDSGGAGLGLAIVADVVSVHRGSVTVEDASPGAVFTIRIPISER